jgi:hypothetical protein
MARDVFGVTSSLPANDNYSIKIPKVEVIPARDGLSIGAGHFLCRLGL